MIRSVVVIAILFVATFFLPFWTQGILYVGAIFLIRHRLLILMPAIFADAWYSPSHTLSLSNNKTFLIVLGMLVVYFLIIKNTRIIQKYDLEKK